MKVHGYHRHLDTHDTHARITVRIGWGETGGWGGGEWGGGLERPDGDGDYDLARCVERGCERRKHDGHHESGHAPSGVCVYSGTTGCVGQTEEDGCAPELLALALDGNDLVPSHLRLHVSVRTGAGTVCSEAQARGLEVNCCCCWREVNCEQESERSTTLP